MSNSYYVYYCIQLGQDPSDNDYARSSSLGCNSVNLGDPTGGLVEVWPSIVVTSTVNPTTVIPDDQSQATVDEVNQAISVASSTISNIQQATTNLQNLLGQMQPALAQGQADLVTLSGSSDPLAGILARNVEGSLTLAQATSDILTILNLITTVS